MVKFTTSLPLSGQCGDGKGKVNQERNLEVHPSILWSLAYRAIIARLIEKMML